MNKYKRLLSNTVVFSIGSFGSKLLLFLLVPIYTNVLSTSQYGKADLIYTTITLICPVFSLGITEASMRFALQGNTDKSQVLTAAVRIALTGGIVLAMLTPLFYAIPYFKGFGVFFPLLYFAISLKGILSQFCRGIWKTKLFAVDGILSAFTLLASNIILLVFFKAGVTGYLLSVVISNALSCAFLLLAGKLYRYFRFTRINRSLTREMLLYAVPLIPNSLFWWITMTSDRYFVTALRGSAVNGVYSAAYKVPTIMSVFVDIFMQAWQLSAIHEYENGRDEKFYSGVYRYYSLFVFLCGSALIVLTKPISHVLFAGSFYAAWYFVPLLMCAVTVGNLQTYFGTIYTSAKKTLRCLMTTMAGALLNIALNFLLIPHYGASGAAFATFLSYLVVMICRMLDTRHFIKIRIDLFQTISGTALVLTQSAVLMLGLPFATGITSALFLLFAAFHFRTLRTLTAGGVHMLRSVAADLRKHGAAGPSNTSKR